MATKDYLSSYPVVHNSFDQVVWHDPKEQDILRFSDARLRLRGKASNGSILYRPSLPSRSYSGLSLDSSLGTPGTVSTCKTLSTRPSRAASTFSDKRIVVAETQAVRPDNESAYHTQQPIKPRRSFAGFSDSQQTAISLRQTKSLSDLSSQNRGSLPTFQNEIKPRSLKGAIRTPHAEHDLVINHPRRSGDHDADRSEVSASLQEKPAESEGTHRNLYPDALAFYNAAIEGHEICVSSIEPKLRPDANDEVLKKKGARRIKLQKHAMQLSQTGMNALAIFSTWWWMKYYYILLPFITATVAMNCIMIFSIILRVVKNRISPEKKVIPETPESMVLLIPCYNETKEEMLKSLDSLVAQSNVDSHQRAIMIVCDGKVRGPGMEKTTADYLLHDILVDKKERRHVRAAYLAWDQQPMDIVLQTGTYGGLPYVCIVKQQNQGKRDGLIVVRSFLYNFNIREQRPKVLFSSELFARLTKFLLQAGFDKVDLLIGMDADTTFNETCISSLLEESRYPKTVGVCGYVMVDFSGGQWNIWRLYQSAEYTIAQGLRRLHQSIVTKKVSCLPGCCQLLKVCEETCGDEVLVEKFGYCPTIQDGLLTQIRATASEDRNHVCHMLSARPQAETRQALAARAVTDVPHSWSVFLSQRRRWTLGATSNDLLLVTAPGVQWFERILATVNVFTWFLNPFIFASVASFIVAILHVPVAILLAFVSVMLLPICYYMCIPLWITKSWRERFQFWAGCVCYIFCGPFINIAVLLYAFWNMDSFGWGKTRKVISSDELSDHSDSNDALPDIQQPEATGAVTKHAPLAGLDRTDALNVEEKKIGMTI